MSCISDVEIDQELLKSVLLKASETADEYVLSLMLEVAGLNYTNHHHINNEALFMEALRRLREFGSTNWVQLIWRLRDLRDLILSLSKENAAEFLGALVFVQNVDFHVEELLEPIAEAYPELVLEFFRKRIDHEDKSKGYESIPFDLHDLKAPLSNHASLIVRTVRSWYDVNDHLFQFRGAKLVANIYPNFSSELEEQLISLVQSGERSDALFVLDILRNYQGQPFLHLVCREIVSLHFPDKKLMTGVYIVLASTGVVRGEYGMAEAYSRKADEIEYWLDDQDKHVREFAKSHIETLKIDEKLERERAQESIELRKHRYGATDD